MVGETFGDQEVASPHMMGEGLLTEPNSPRSETVGDRQDSGHNATVPCQRPIMFSVVQFRRDYRSYLSESHNT